VNEQDVAHPGAAPAVVGGRYVLGELLGAGSSAEVHRAADRISGRSFAVKLFHAGASVHDRRRQQREMRALAQLHHPGLVALHDGGVEAGRPFLVTDLVEGPTLAEVIANGPLPADDVRRIGTALADALAHVHRSGIVHRDLKPANVLLAPDGRPRLTDFGIARAIDATAVTGTGFVVGTAAYLAPEQVCGERVGPAADVYALGLVLLEALTGRREYPGALVESATARLHRPPAVPPHPPEPLGTALHAMTTRDPAARPTAADVAVLLATGALPGRRRRGAHRRRRGATTPRAAGLAATAAVVAALGVGVLPSSAPRSAFAAPERTGAPAPAAAARPAFGPVAVPVDRVSASLGDGVAAARRGLPGRAQKIGTGRGVSVR
jgi:hypothetical protein